MAEVWMMNSNWLTRDDKFPSWSWVPECGWYDFFDFLLYGFALFCFHFSVFFQYKISFHRAFWSMFQRAGLHSSETTSGFVLAYGKSRQKFTWACWKMEGIIPDGSFFFSCVFFSKSFSWTMPLHPTKIESFSWRSPLPKSYTSRSEWLKVVESQPRNCCVDVPWGLPPPGSLERSHQIDHEEVKPRGGIWQQMYRETDPYRS